MGKREQMTPYMTIIIICVLIIAYGILFYYYCKAEDNKRRYLWNIYYGEHKQMTIAEILIQHLENKEYDKFYELYEQIRDRSFGYNDSRGAIIEVLLPMESVSK